MKTTPSDSARPRLVRKTWAEGSGRATRSSRMRRPIYAASALFLASTAVFCLAGCGRKATRSDCELVVDKNVEVKLKADGMSDPPLVAKRKEELRASLKDDIDKCVGKRVTDGMLTCVKGAETAEQIDKCLR